MRKTGFKEIYVFIAGSTPQVITETIFALADKKPPVYPDEINIITTNRGKQIVYDALINKGKLKELCGEYKVPAVSLGVSSFIVPLDSGGKYLEDIRNETDNELMGDLITSFIKEKTTDLSARLHCSIAGGRKTMSFYLGAAMQLFGRPWDKLYHVLVTPEFESNPDFFYKPKKDRIITPPNPLLHQEGEGRTPPFSPSLTKRGMGGVMGKRLKLLNTKDAEITLAELPFIRLRDKLTLGGSTFKELVTEGQKEIDIATVQPSLTIYPSEQTVAIGHKKIKLSPFHLVIYMAYLKYKLHRCKHSDRPYCMDCTDCFPSLLELATKPALEEMAKDYMKITPSKVSDLLHKYNGGLPTDIIRQAVSKIKKVFNEKLGDEAVASCYAITTSHKGYSNTRHGIRAEKGKIRIE